MERNLSRPQPRNRQPHALMRMPQWVSHNAGIDGAEFHGKTLVSTWDDQVNIHGTSKSHQPSRPRKRAYMKRVRHKANDAIGQAPISRNKTDLIYVCSLNFV